jgi:hypothetical protein
MRSQRQPNPGGGSGRRIAGRAQRDRILDPYESQRKPHEPASCPQCGAVYRHGRWQWSPAPEAAHAHLCPACHRTAEHLPAGIVTLHRLPPRLTDQVIGLVRNEEAAEKSEHALNRVIAIEEADGDLVVSTTDIHLPRRIGEALKRAYHGELDMHFDDDGYFARVDWHPPN